ncbi:PREDICTED: uncharacterized protein LOC109348239 isoform X2 [Lupinus angustifolius]|uniref:uncharacterized protein LOC109348239 isoform X2 n=1 Tax=Lupinus angustifolius TaxID=3871 RepID=UPI00092FB0A0|nr:PREDICTED: uncharacterized protein LOC109348239 isoform X2 [Lupinus angustifolius]
MEPENIDWDNIDSTFVQDDAYENFNAPKWVDLSSNEVLDVDDEAWFCTHDCKHPKTAEDFLKSTATRNTKGKLLRFASFSEIRPFRRQNSSPEGRSYVKLSEKSRRPNCSGNSNEENENKNPNFSSSNPNFSSSNPKGITTNPKKPLMRSESKIPKHPVKNDRKLKSTFSAQNLLGGRDILNQITGFCSELKRLASTRKCYYKKGESEKCSSSSDVSEELKKEEVVVKERVPLLKVKNRK